MHINLRIAAVLVAGWTTLLLADLPLVMGPLVTGPNSHVRVTNTTTQAVTAWALATTVPGADGRTRREVETVDGYLSEVTEGLPGSVTRLNRLLPGQSRDIALDPLPADATVQMIAVILDDGTALGDEPTIRAIFERRVKERDALGTVVAAFNEVLSDSRPVGTAGVPGGGPGPLDILRQRLERIAERDSSIPVRAALEAVESLQTQAAGRPPEQTDQSLNRYARLVARQYELATKHSQRKNQP